MKITYRIGCKYQLCDDYIHALPGTFKYFKTFDSDFVYYKYPELVIKKGYAWDGASSVARDTRDIMRASLVHDALYLAMRTGMLPIEAKPLADKELFKISRRDGMSRFRATYTYLAVKIFGKKAILEKDKIATAP